MIHDGKLEGLDLGGPVDLNGKVAAAGEKIDRALDGMIRLLADGDDAVVRGAALTLTAFGLVAVPRLAATLSGARGIRLRIGAAVVLGLIGRSNPRFVSPFLMKAAHGTKNPKVMRSIEEALGIAFVPSLTRPDRAPAAAEPEKTGPRLKRRAKPPGPPDVSPS